VFHLQPVLALGVSEAGPINSELMRLQLASPLAALRLCRSLQLSILNPPSLNPASTSGIAALSQPEVWSMQSL
jgi:hypothetical protein